MSRLKRVKSKNVPCGLTCYNELVHVGENVWPHFCHMNFNSPVLLDHIPNQSIFVLIEVEQLQGIEGIVLTGPARSHKDGYALLLLATDDSVQSRLPPDFINDLRKAKNNIIKKGQQHFNSKGEIIHSELLVDITARVV
eukprot:859995-Ditylum_brightwellii.AAC.1